MVIDSSDLLLIFGLLLLFTINSNLNKRAINISDKSIRDKDQNIYIVREKERIVEPKRFYDSKYHKTRYGDQYSYPWLHRLISKLIFRLTTLKISNRFMGVKHIRSNHGITLHPYLICNKDPNRDLGTIARHGRFFQKNHVNVNGKPITPKSIKLMPLDMYLINLLCLIF